MHRRECAVIGQNTIANKHSVSQITTTVRVLVTRTTTVGTTTITLSQPDSIDSSQPTIAPVLGAGN